MYIYCSDIIACRPQRKYLGQSFVCSKMFTGFWISSSKALPFKGVFNQFKSWGLSYSWKCIKRVYTVKVKKKNGQGDIVGIFPGQAW